MTKAGQGNCACGLDEVLLTVMVKYWNALVNIVRIVYLMEYNLQRANYWNF